MYNIKMNLTLICSNYKVIKALPKFIITIIKSLSDYNIVMFLEVDSATQKSDITY